MPNELESNLKLFHDRLGNIERLLEGILHRLARPAGFVVKLSGAVPEKGKKKMPNVDQQFLDNGKIRVTLTPKDAQGNTTDPATGKPVVLPAGTPPVTLTDSAGLLTFTIDPTDTSGFGLIQLGTASGDTVGDVITASATLPGATSPITGTGDPFDIIAVPPTVDNPAGFAVVESQA
jgi:hypothetical protein